MQLKRRGHPAKAAVAFLWLGPPADRGFELQLVPPGISPKALKRGKDDREAPPTTPAGSNGEA